MISMPVGLVGGPMGEGDARSAERFPHEGKKTKPIGAILVKLLVISKIGE